MREDGTEVKRYRVTSAFSDLLIDGAELQRRLFLQARNGKGRKPRAGDFDYEIIRSKSRTIWVSFGVLLLWRLIR